MSISYATGAISNRTTAKQIMPQVCAANFARMPVIITPHPNNDAAMSERWPARCARRLALALAGGEAAYRARGRQCRVKGMFQNIHRHRDTSGGRPHKLDDVEGPLVRELPGNSQRLLLIWSKIQPFHAIRGAA